MILVMTRLRSRLRRLRHLRNRRRKEYNYEGQDDNLYMDINNDNDDVSDDIPGDAADQVPVEEVGEQITPRPQELEQE